MDYVEYLQSEHWQRFSSEIKAGRRCEDCNLSPLWSRHFYGEDLNVHHLTYENLGHETAADVAVLCVKCHSVRHGLTPPAVYSIPQFARLEFVERFRMEPEPDDYHRHVALVRFQASVLASCLGIRRAA